MQGSDVFDVGFGDEGYARATELSVLDVTNLPYSLPDVLRHCEVKKTKVKGMVVVASIFEDVALCVNARGAVRVKSRGLSTSPPRFTSLTQEVVATLPS